jgi:C-terminal processing protease CtpA/Prc
MTRYYDILWSYVDKGSRQQAGGKHSNLLQWGTINRRLGYLLVNSMTSISTNRNATSLDDVGAIKGILDRVMRDLRDTAAMIIDVRFNGGGDDAVGLAIVNRFTDKRRLAVAKTARSYRGETPRREAYLTPEGDKPYLKPVVVIAGPDSASATEIFIMGMRALPQVIQLGEPTNGILSDELYKTLPKGWKFTLSNEVYYDYKGVNHEVSGTVPQIQTPVFSLKDLETGHNSALETALKVLTHQEPTALGINEGTL